MDLQVGGSSRFRVDRAGVLISSGSVISGSDIVATNGRFIQWSTRSVLGSPSDGNITLYSSSLSDFNRLQLGGTTNAFPAIKRNGAAIDFRLADDSGFCDITARQVFASLGAIYLNTAATAFILRGSGTPEGVVTAIVGSLFLRSDGGAGTTLYVKESGTGNTGWVAK